MRQKKWKDCPSCGSMGSMKLKKGVKETFKNKEYKAITITGLEGYFCDQCKDGIYTIKSQSKISSVLAEEMAKQDSARIVASKLITIDEAAKKLKKSRQRIHQMMDEGKLHYVFVGNLRFPIKDDLSKAIG